MNLEEYMLRLLNTVHRLQHLTAVPFFEAGLSRTEALALMRACGPPEGAEVPPDVQPALQASELAKELGVSAAAISQVMACLESRGLIRREPSNKDKRVTEILPTEQGCTLANKVKENCVRLNDLLLQRMTDEERRHFSSILDKVSAIVTEESNRLGLPRKRPRHKCTNGRAPYQADARATVVSCNPSAQGDPDSA